LRVRYSLVDWPIPLSLEPEVMTQRTLLRIRKAMADQHTHHAGLKLQNINS
tara:strand:+ start:353 stop:505 length:153 start_codon:yes stop_codon:yes gene_type:complete